MDRRPAREAVVGSCGRPSDGGLQRKIAQGYHYVGVGCTNNVCEYFGLIHGLKYIRNELQCVRLHIQGDSELVIQQLNHTYRVDSFRLRPLVRQVRGLLRRFDPPFEVKFTHIPRHGNRDADRLANEAIEEERHHVESF